MGGDMDLRRTPARNERSPAMTDMPSIPDLARLDLPTLCALQRELRLRVTLGAECSPERRAALAGLQAVERAIARILARPPPGPSL